MKQRKTIEEFIESLPVSSSMEGLDSTVISPDMQGLGINEAANGPGGCSNEVAGSCETNMYYCVNYGTSCVYSDNVTTCTNKPSKPATNYVQGCN